MTKTLSIKKALLYFEYNPELGKLFWKVDRPYHKCKGLEAGGVDTKGYRRVKLNRVEYKTHRVIWLMETGRWPKEHLDHINGVTDDNRFLNLRLATIQENGKNRKVGSNNRSGFIGVCWEKGKWRSQIFVDGKSVRLGRFPPDFEGMMMALAARKNAEDHYGYHKNHGRAL
jgi:hypothetical protein